MTEVDLTPLSVSELLRTYSRVVGVLRERGVLRTSNGPAGDYAEFLFCRAFGWVRQGDSAPGFDAKDTDGRRYQIKGRRLATKNASRELSVMRRLDEQPFDFLAAVLFHEDFRVFKGALIPLDVVKTASKYSEHVHGWRLLLRDSLWDEANVKDVKPDLEMAAASI